MKRILLTLVLCFLFLAVAGCDGNKDTIGAEEPVYEHLTESEIPFTIIDYNYVESLGKYDFSYDIGMFNSQPNVIIRTAQELDIVLSKSDITEEKKKNYSLYNDEFFSDNIMVFYSVRYASSDIQGEECDGAKRQENYVGLKLCGLRKNNSGKLDNVIFDIRGATEVSTDDVRTRQFVFSVAKAYDPGADIIKSVFHNFNDEKSLVV